MTVPVTAPIEERGGVSPQTVADTVSGRRAPLVLRGFAEDWPAVRAGAQSDAALREHLLSHYAGATASASFGPPEAEGRLFYNSDFTATNCEQRRTTLDAVLDAVIAQCAAPRPPLIYMASTTIDTLLPGFHERHASGLEAKNPLGSIWIGGPSRIPAHQDLPDNLAVVAAGRRRFTVFPPEQLPNLYIGPLDVTPAGQPVSLADLDAPDFDAFPRLREALDAAMAAELAPGDAIFIPSMWWHHVQASAPLNVLVNYWWREAPAHMGPPQNALHHAILALRGLPPEDKAIWRQVFDHYVFSDPETAAAHIPETARGVLGDMTEPNARRLRAYLLNRLNR